MQCAAACGVRRGLFPVAVFGTLGLGCGGSAETSAGTDEMTASENLDVQVVSAKSDGTIQWGDGGFMGYDALKCRYFDAKPLPEPREFTSTAKADCTEPFVAKEGPSIDRYVEPIAWIREAPNVVHASFRHWCGRIEVVVAVKAAAWDAPSFEGIGFFADAHAINVSDTRVFYEKGDGRLLRIGEAKLKNSNLERAYLYKFSGAGPCEANGTGDNPGGSVDFKPYGSFAGGHERWEAVPGNHRIAYRQAWDRRSELLQ